MMVTDLNEGYKSTEIGLIPTDWDLKNVEELASVATGNKDTQNKLENGIYDFYVRSPKVEKINSYSFDGEAVLTAGDGVGVGKVYHYVKGKFDYHQRVYKISDFKNINGKFFFYYFSENFIKVARKFNSKTSVDSVRRHMITEMKVPIPPMKEQNEIVSILEAADGQIEKTDQLIEKTKELKIGLMQQLLTKGLNHSSFKQTVVGELPEAWNVYKIKDVALKVTDGEHKTPNRIESGELLLSARNIINGRIDYSNVDYISKDELDKITKRCHPEMGDILLSCSGSIGRVCIVPNNIKFGLVRSVALIKIDKEVLNSKFLMYILQSPLLQKQMEMKQSKLAQANLFLRDINSLIIPFPSLEEQLEIAQIISSVDEQINSYEKEKEKQIELKKALMQQLLTGKIRVTV